ncbi:MAG: minichromosome maintenance protein MCM [Candidatus Aenigmarchaeota archaeon]|nr:minichromosome maintenance protein MCM [Candidatus Aenigmarchaeota archaeon]
MDNEQERFEEFLRQFYEQDLLTATREGKKSIAVDFSNLDKFDPELADKLLNEPERLLPIVNFALRELDVPEGTEGFKVRFINLPESATIRIRSLRSEHIGKFIAVEGTVRRASEVRPEISIAIFQCPECTAKFGVEQKERMLNGPVACPECGIKARFDMVDRKLYDSRVITLEEPYETASGERPGEVNISMKEDLTTPDMQRKTDPGNRLKIVGIVKELHRMIKGRMKTQMEMFIETNSIESTDVEWEEVNTTAQDEEKIMEFAADPEIYKKLRESLAPSIYGLGEIKDAIILQLFGGVRHKFPDGTKIRGDIHVLLLGDPGVAKSQLLKLTSSIIPRGKYVSGRGATGAGLTATVVKDEELMGGWVLEAGAMVLANKGIMAIDEFDKISVEDQVAMHEALEQQTVSIAKASIVATLPAQVSVLAGANPKFSRFDPYKSIAEQLTIPDTLLSRFDLKFALRDIPDPVKDEKLAAHILETRLAPEKVEPLIKPEFLRKYIAYCRKNAHPIMTREAAERLKQFYLTMRSLYSGSNTVAITLRQNEALIRLSEASAKIRLSPTVEVQDAERAINVMQESIKQLGYDYETGKLDVDKLEGGTPASQRTKITMILDLIGKLEKSLGKQIPKEELLAAAEDEGINEKDFEELLQRLKREGMIFEPRTGFVQKI